MKLKEIMTQDVEVIHPGDSLQTAAAKMRDCDIGFLPVYDDGQLIGVLTDRDIAIRAIANGVDSKMPINADLISTPAIFCFEDQSVDDATELMHDQQVRRLVILKRGSQQLAGVISLGDLAVNIDDKISGEVLEGVSMP